MKRILILVLALAGCTSLATGQTYSEEAMLTAAAALTKVSAATEAFLRYGSPPDGLPDDAFLTQSVAHDPGLLAPFSTYRVKATRVNGHTAVLVCTPDGTEALLEDAGCTATMDKQRWRDDSKSPCAFALDLNQVCSAVAN